MEENTICLISSTSKSEENFKQVDIYGYQRTTLVLEWMGKHALIIYILAACNIMPIIILGFYWKQPQNNIVSSLDLPREISWPSNFISFQNFTSLLDTAAL